MIQTSETQEEKQQRTSSILIQCEAEKEESHSRNSFLNSDLVN